MTRIWTNIEPIDNLLKTVNENGIPIPSVIALAQENFGDATRFILYNLIDNFIRKDFKCIYVLFNTGQFNNNSMVDKEFERFVKKWDYSHFKKRNKLITFADLLDEYLFSWDKIPGDESKRLNHFLMKNYKTNWIANAKIEKIGYTIKITSGGDSFSIELNDKKTKAYLKINNDIDDILDEFIVKKEDDQFKIYISSERKKAFLKIMDADYLYTNLGNNKEFDGKTFTKFNDYIKNGELNFIEFDDISNFIKNYDELTSEYQNDKKIVIFGNSSWILEAFEKSSPKINIPKESSINPFFELCKQFDENTIVFHFFTLSMHDDRTKNRIGDLVDGFIHLKSMTKNILRPLRSVGIRKMRGVRESAEYNAYRFDDYGVVKEFK